MCVSYYVRMQLFVFVSVYVEYTCMHVFVCLHQGPCRVCLHLCLYLWSISGHVTVYASVLFS